MIAIDASAFLAIFLKEPERDAFLAVVEASPTIMSPVNYWEVLAKVRRVRGEIGVSQAEQLLADLGVRVATLEQAEAKRAYEAFAAFGKGMSGPLNLGDCFAYALAEREGDGLLFKGNDFPKTDVKSAI